MPDPRHPDAGLARLTAFLQEPRTFAAIQRYTRQKNRTVYRWMRYLVAEGHRVASDKGADQKIRFWLV